MDVLSGIEEALAAALQVSYRIECALVDGVSVLVSGIMRMWLTLAVTDVFVQLEAGELIASVGFLESGPEGVGLLVVGGALTGFDEAGHLENCDGEVVFSWKFTGGAVLQFVLKGLFELGREDDGEQLGLIILIARTPTAQIPKLSKCRHNS